MQIVQGKYKNGRIRLSRKLRTRKEQDVLVFFPTPSRQKKQGLSGKEARKLIGLVQLGGDALRDSEALYS